MNKLSELLLTFASAAAVLVSTQRVARSATATSAIGSGSTFTLNSGSITAIARLGWE